MVGSSNNIIMLLTIHMFSHCSLLLYGMEAVDRILLKGEKLGYKHLKEEQVEVSFELVFTPSYNEFGLQYSDKTVYF